MLLSSFVQGHSNSSLGLHCLLLDRWRYEEESALSCFVTNNTCTNTKHVRQEAIKLIHHHSKQCELLTDAEPPDDLGAITENLTTWMVPANSANGEKMKRRFMIVFVDWQLINAFVCCVNEVIRL
jgi:hypothetical protein